MTHEPADHGIAVAQQRWLARVLGDETVGGVILLVCAVAALIWANSEYSHGYEKFTHYEFGPSSLGLHLPLHIWVADGLLAVFFFVAGIELKHEFVSGTLATPRLAAVPMTAAFTGMAFAALIFTSVNHGTNVASAWGLPISTDIAFALAVLAVVGRGLPIALRSFLLTLAVVNDLGAITVIALFYSHHFHVGFFVLAVGFLMLFGWLQRIGVRSAPVFGVLALLIWYATFKSGIHATVAGVGMGLLMRVHTRPGEVVAPADRTDQILRPFSAGLCAPLFALVSAGVVLEGVALDQLLGQPLTIGVVLGLVIGQPLGITLGAFLAVRFTKAEKNPALSWWDIVTVGVLASIGFTVALLINEMTFVNNESLLATGKFAIVLTNLLAIAISSIVVLLRTRAIRLSSQ